jgi:hypothetical protein
MQMIWQDDDGGDLERAFLAGFAEGFWSDFELCIAYAITLNWPRWSQAVR